MARTLNYFEESCIKNKHLPEEWQTQAALSELETFLQFNWGQRAVFYEDGEITSRQQFLRFESRGGIRTSHYVGTISFNGCQVNIFPKVFRENQDDADTTGLDLRHLMKNLLQWLRYCNRMEYPFINSIYSLQDCDSLRELFVTLYLHYVKDALRRGAFHRYEEKREDLSTIKGQIDFKDYINYKLPTKQAHRFLCSFSEFEFDNQLNRIIKYTCKQLSKCTSSAENREVIRQILIRMNDVSDTYCAPSDCDGIRLGKLHRRYSIILSMSKMFLLNQTVGYEMNNHDSFCFLFPTELLFEGFIGGFIRETLEGEAKVRLQASDQTLIQRVMFAGKDLGKAFTMRHDILIEHDSCGVFVLDTKYKQMPRFEGHPNVKQLVTSNVLQGDLYQVLEYAAHRNLGDAYLLYPMFRFEDEEPHELILQRVSDSGHTINVHIVRMPFVFEEDIERTKTFLTNSIRRIVQEVQA